MGLDFIREKALKFEQKRDASSTRMVETSDLLERVSPDRVVEYYRVQLLDFDAVIQPGLRLLMKIYSNQDITLSQNGKLIGKLLEPDASLMRSNYEASAEVSGMITVLIADDPDAFGVFKIRLLNPLRKEN